MVEKFDEYEGGFIDREGKFEFTITSAELKDSKNGDPMWVFEVKCDVGTSTIYHSLKKNARWTFNKLIKACMKGQPPKELDYETYGQQLVGKKFIADVFEDSYDKEVKVPNEDGTFDTVIKTQKSYKIDTTSYTYEGV